MSCEAAADMFRLVPTFCAEDLKPSIFEPLSGRRTIERHQLLLALEAPSIGPRGVRLVPPEKPNALVPVNSVCDVLADKPNTLNAMRGTVALLWVRTHED